MARQNGDMATLSDAAPHPDSFGARSVLSVAGRDYEIFDLGARALADAHDIERLPYSIKVLLENLLRHEDSPHVSPDDITATAAWAANPEAHGQAAGDAAHEIALDARACLDAGLHRRARGGGPRGHPRRIGPPWWQRRSGQPLGPGGVGDRSLGHCRRVRRRVGL